MKTSKFRYLCMSVQKRWCIFVYNSINIAETIKKTAQDNNIPVKQVLADAGLGSNTMSNFKTSMPKADNLAKIADVLNCSVDYLLGRIDNPKAYIGSESKTERELISLITMLTPEQQELVLAQIRGILANQQKK